MGIALGTAIVSLATAITGLVRTVLEKKSARKGGRGESSFQKKPNSVPRGIAENRLTHTLVAFSKKPSAEIKLFVPDWTKKQWELLTSNLLLLCAAHHGSLQKKL
jgi:hypothetical protein